MLATIGMFIRVVKELVLAKADINTRSRVCKYTFSLIIICIKVCLDLEARIVIVNRSLRKLYYMYIRVSCGVPVSSKSLDSFLKFIEASYTRHRYHVSVVKYGCFRTDIRTSNTCAEQFIRVHSLLLRM